MSLTPPEASQNGPRPSRFSTLRSNFTMVYLGFYLGSLFGTHAAIAQAGGYYFLRTHSGPYFHVPLRTVGLGTILGTAFMSYKLFSNDTESQNPASQNLMILMMPNVGIMGATIGALVGLRRCTGVARWGAAGMGSVMASTVQSNVFGQAPVRAIPVQANGGSAGNGMSS